MDSKTERPAVLNATAEDESFLLGTRAQLASLARQLFELLEAPAESRDWAGVITEHPTCSAALTDPMSDVVLDGIVIVRSEEDRRTLTNWIRVNCGDEPIDWDQ